MVQKEGVMQGHFRELGLRYDDALARLPEALQAEGFGILTQIDVQETFRAKLGVPFRRYRIFGACNPGFAHKALTQELRVGVLLPCNVVLYEADDGRAVLGVVDPMQTLGAAANEDELAPLAREVDGRLVRVMDALSS